MLKGLKKGRSLLSLGWILPKKRSIQEKALLKESLEEKIKEEARREAPIQRIPMEDTNPLMGFITPTNVTVGKIEVSQSNQANLNDGLENRNKLSEQTPICFSMNAISWNCRGSAAKGFSSLIKDMSKEYEASIFFFS